MIEDEVYEQIKEDNVALYVQCGEKKIYPRFRNNRLVFRMDEFSNDSDDIHVGVDGDYTHKQKEDILVHVLTLCPFLISY